MASRTQISAYVSAETKELVERYAKAHGVKKGFLIESALLHHMQALRELPADVIIPPVITVTRKSGEVMIERIEGPREPTEAMRALFEGAPDDGVD